VKRILFATCLVAAAVAFATGLPAAEVAPAPKLITERDDLFRKHRVLDITIDVSKQEREKLNRENRKYVKCTLKEGGTEYADVGIHLKGAAGSFRGFDDKPGLTLNMDKFADGQRFHGLDKWHLSNSVQDPSYLSELICGELFRAAGVPASRITHATLTLNGRKRGLYYLKEGYDKQFLKNHFGNSGGNFYDGGFLRDIDQELQLVSSKDDVPKHGDLKALLAACRERDEKVRFEKMAKLLDMDKFVSFLVLEAITWDWDGYPMNRNNYRIYHDPKSNKLTFIPSGMDQMFGDPNGPILPNFQGFVAASLMQTKEGKKRYYARMREIMNTVYSVDALTRRLNELEAVVQPALASVDAGAGRDYKHHVNRLRDAIKQRAKSVNEQLRRLPPESK
jgi:spore coat protein CotH